MNVQLAKEKLIAQIGELPPMPDVAQRAMTLIQDPDSNISEIADILALDEALTILILRWANSAYYGLARPVSTVKQAMVYLGYRTVENLILAASMVNLMDRPLHGYHMERGELWKHAIGVAAGARWVTKIFGRRKAEDAYFAGLLCDIGKLALDSYLCEHTIQTAKMGDRTYILVEQELIGINHAELGAAITQQWNLPLELQDAIAFHHNPENATEGLILAAAVNVADCAMNQLSSDMEEELLPEESALERLRLSHADFSALANRIQIFINETESFLKMGSE
ncbi:MAG: HDOD domain-containing protein [Anaerolineales bacterium]|nr:HDOD domain-containing protein [Anaerolineales bacterium]